MTERERYRQFISDVVLAGGERGKLARRVLDGMTLDEARRDLEDTNARRAAFSQHGQARANDAAGGLNPRGWMTLS